MSYKFNDLQLKWLAALESGDFKQISGALVRDDGHCCLGVACEVAGVARIYSGYADSAYACGGGYVKSFLPESLKKELRLRSDSGSIDGRPGYTSLTQLNDVVQLSFADIAKFIRENPEKVFIDEDQNAL